MTDYAESYIPLLLATIPTYFSINNQWMIGSYIELGIMRGYLVIGILGLWAVPFYFIAGIIDSFTKNKSKRINKP